MKHALCATRFVFDLHSRVHIYMFWCPFICRRNSGFCARNTRKTLRISTGVCVCVLWCKCVCAYIIEYIRFKYALARALYFLSERAHHKRVPLQKRRGTRHIFVCLCRNLVRNTTFIPHVDKRRFAGLSLVSDFSVLRRFRDREVRTEWWEASKKKKVRFHQLCKLRTQLRREHTRPINKYRARAIIISYIVCIYINCMDGVL